MVLGGHSLTHPGVHGKVSNMANNLLGNVTTKITNIPPGRRAGERNGFQGLLRSLRELPDGQALRVHKDYNMAEGADKQGHARQKMLYSSLQFASRRTGIKINCQVAGDGTGDVLVWLRSSK